MSDDPDLDFLGAALPLPYRVALILIAGMSSHCREARGRHACV